MIKQIFFFILLVGCLYAYNFGEIAPNDKSEIISADMGVKLDSYSSETVAVLVDAKNNPIAEVGLLNDYSIDKETEVMTVKDCGGLSGKYDCRLVFNYNAKTQQSIDPVKSYSGDVVSVMTAEEPKGKEKPVSFTKLQYYDGIWDNTYETYDEKRWKDLTDKDAMVFAKEGNYVLGFVYSRIDQKEVYDLIPSLYGVNLEKFIVWNSTQFITE